MKLHLSIFFVFLSTLVFSQVPNWQWAKSHGSSAADNASGITNDNIGNSYVCGYFYSASLTIGASSLINNGNYDSYVAKLDVSGNVLWAKSFGGTFDDNATAIAIDASGNSFVTGYFISPIMTIGTVTLTNSGAGDIFILKFDTFGNLVWAKNVGDGGSNQANSIATDPSGNIFVTGMFNNPTLTLGTYTLSSSGNDDIFVAKYNTGGNVIWAMSAGDNLSDSGNGITTDASGNVFVTGYFKSGSLALGTATLVNNSATSADLFLMKLNNSGSVVAANSAGDMFDEVGSGITTDGSGNVIITGSFFSPSLVVGTTTLTNYGNRDVIIIKYNNACNLIWARNGGGSFDDYGYGIDTDAGGNIYVNGHNHSFNAAFGTYTLSMGGVGDAFLAAYSAVGSALWAVGVGGGNDDGWNALSTDGAGNVYCAGYFSSATVTLGLSNLTSNGSADLLIAKLVTSNAVAENKLNTEELFTLYPNPSNGELNIKIKVPTSQTKAEVYSLTGSLIRSFEFDEEIYKINLVSELPGVYFVKIICGNAILCKKLILN